MPDKYDTQRYGQDIADLGGVAGANGQNFVEDAQLKAVLGGRTGIAAIEETLAQYGSASQAPSWLAGMFDKLKSMFGISNRGSGKLNFEHVIKNEWVSGAQGTSGQHYTYTDLAQALNDFANAEQSAGGAPAPALVRTQPFLRHQLDNASAVPTVAAPARSQNPISVDLMASRYGWAEQHRSEPRELLVL